MIRKPLQRVKYLYLFELVSATSSIYHFFARLVLRRGYFRVAEKLDGFEYPSDMTHIGSSGGFPDFVLKTNGYDSEFTGGEMIELKDAKSYSISSFNSTIPSELKSVSALTQSLRNQMAITGENPDDFPDRLVYYLLRGRDIKAEPAPKVKVCLVSGKFFETVPVAELLPAAFREVALDASDSEVEIPDEYLRLFRHQADFASSREIEGASVKIRFRVMAEVHPSTNLFRQQNYPMIGDDTLSLVVPEEGLGDVNSEGIEYSWDDCSESFRNSSAFRYLDMAFDEVDASLKDEATLCKLQHPMNGPFLLVRFNL